MRLIFILLTVANLAFAQNIPICIADIKVVKNVYSLQIEDTKLEFELPDKEFKSCWGISISKIPGTESVYVVGLWSVLKYNDLKSEIGEYLSLQYWTARIDAHENNKLIWNKAGMLAGWGNYHVFKNTININVKQLEYVNMGSSVKLKLNFIKVD